MEPKKKKINETQVRTAREEKTDKRTTVNQSINPTSNKKALVNNFPINNHFKCICLDATNKRCQEAERGGQVSTRYCLREFHFKLKDITAAEGKGMENIYSKQMATEREQVFNRKEHV